MPVPPFAPFAPLLGLAGADCEALTSGALAQPVNSVSSLAFLIAGAWIVLRARRAPSNHARLLVFGVAVASNAIGGLLLHGLQTPGARFIHDLAIGSVLGFVVVFSAARVLTRPMRWLCRAYLASLGGLGLLLAALPNADFAVFGVLGLAAGLGGVAEYRHELAVLRSEGLTARRAARIGALVALALGATAYLVGRSSSPLCNPASAFQWHAAWHVLAAAAMGLYAYGAVWTRPASAALG